jgi:hypothetical protein
VELGEGAPGRVEGVVIRIADARHEVPVVSGRARKLERRPRRDDMPSPARVEHVGEADQVPLVGPAPVVEDQQPLRRLRRRAVDVD